MQLLESCSAFGPEILYKELGGTEEDGPGIEEVGDT
jgi:hypothetical protein